MMWTNAPLWIHSLNVYAQVNVKTVKQLNIENWDMLNVKNMTLVYHETSKQDILKSTFVVWSSAHVCLSVCLPACLSACLCDLVDYFTLWFICFIKRPTAASQSPLLLIKGTDPFPSFNCKRTWFVCNLNRCYCALMNPMNPMNDLWGK